MKKELSGPVIAVVILIAIALFGWVVYRGVTGGVQGDGKVGNVEASPPIGPGAKQGLKDHYIPR